MRKEINSLFQVHPLSSQQFPSHRFVAVVSSPAISSRRHFVAISFVARTLSCLPFCRVDFLSPANLSRGHFVASYSVAGTLRRPPFCPVDMHFVDGGRVGLGGLCSKNYPLFYSQIPILSPIIFTNFIDYSHDFTNYSYNSFMKYFRRVHSIRISLVVVLIHGKLHIHCKNRIVKLTKLFCSGNESYMTKFYFVILTKLCVLNLKCIYVLIKQTICNICKQAL